MKKKVKKYRLKRLANKPVRYTLVTGLVIPALSLLVFGVIAGLFAGLTDKPEYMTEYNAVALIIGSILVAIGIRKSLGEDFHYGLGRKGLGIGLLVALPVMVFSVQYIAQGALAEVRPELTAADFLCPLITGIQPGVLEELFYRGLVFGGLMHVRAGKKNRVLVAFLASSLSFALIHMINMLGGQSFIGTVNQLLFALALGAIFCASYLRSHNIWPAIFYHALHDSFAFFLVRTTGASTDGAPSVLQLVMNAILLAYACYIVFSTKSETIDALWGAAKEEPIEEQEELVEEASEI